MSLKNYKMPLRFMLILLAISALFGCTEEKVKQKITLEESLTPFFKALEEDDLGGMRLKKYYKEIYGQGCLGINRRTSEELILWVKESAPEDEIIIENEALRENRALLQGLERVEFEFPNSLEFPQVNICYLFVNANNEVLLEIAVGGAEKGTVIIDGVETSLTVYINGFEIRYSQELCDLLRAIDKIT